MPFGIRALESGTIVEEVWDSRPSSREPSVVDFYRHQNTSSTDISRSSRGLGGRDISGLTVQSASIGHGSLPESFHEHLTPSDSPEREPNATSQRNRYPPHSFSRYEGIRTHRITNSFSRGRTGTARPHIGGKLNRRTVKSVRFVDTIPDGIQTSASASTFLSTASQPGNEYQSNKPERTLRLDTRSARSSMRSSSVESIVAMQERRYSQVAETGQITPRIRREDRSDVDSGPESPMIVVPRRPRAMSFEHDESGEDSDHRKFNAPSIRVTANTPNPDDETSTIDTSNQRSRQKKRLRKKHRSNSNTNSVSPSPTTPTLPGPEYSFVVPSRGETDVLRQVNPGFAVLKPGTVDAAAPRSASVGSVASSVRTGRGKLQKRWSDEPRGRSQ